MLDGELPLEGPGYKTLSIEAPSEVAVARSYISFRKRVGASIPAWERRLRELERDGVLDPGEASAA